MAPSVSEVTSANSINLTLPFSDLRLMKGIWHLRELKKGSLESTCSKIVKDSNSSKHMNLANSVLIQNPKFVSFRQPPMETDNVGNPIDSIAAIKVMDQDGI